MIKEAREQGQAIVLSGILQKAETKNQNGRIYGRGVLEREVKNYSQMVSENRALGTLDHEDSAQISLEKVSHKVRKIWWEGNNVLGEVEILNTPKGKIAQDLLSGGVQIGISSRGVGEVEKNNEGLDVVGEDFLLISFDLVAEPSTPGAWLNLKEGREIDIQNVYKSLPKSVKINRILTEILSKTK
ncbi:MAG: primosomal protein [bacterium]|nr:primosomal protein [bacterium]